MLKRNLFGKRIQQIPNKFIDALKKDRIRKRFKSKTLK